MWGMRGSDETPPADAQASGLGPRASGPDAATVTASAVDPWGGGAADTPACARRWLGDLRDSDAALRLPLVLPAPSPAEARAAAPPAVARRPQSSRLVAGVQLAELRASTAFAHLLANLAGDARVQMLVAMSPPCALAALTSATWIALGAPSLDSSAGAVAIVSGRALATRRRRALPRPRRRGRQLQARRPRDCSRVHRRPQPRAHHARRRRRRGAAARTRRRDADAVRVHVRRRNYADEGRVRARDRQHRQAAGPTTSCRSARPRTAGWSPRPTARGSSCSSTSTPRRPPPRRSSRTTPALGSTARSARRTTRARSPCWATSTWCTTASSAPSSRCAGRLGGMLLEGIAGASEMRVGDHRLLRTHSWSCSRVAGDPTSARLVTPRSRRRRARSGRCTAARQP